MIHSYGQTYEVTDREDLQETTQLINIAKSFAERDMGKWISENSGTVVSKQIKVSEPILRQFYQEYDEDGEGIGVPVYERWVFIIGWKVKINDEVPD